MKRVVQGVVLFSILFFIRCRSHTSEKTHSLETIRVTVEKVNQNTINTGLSFSGNIAAVKQSTLSTRVSGQVEKVFVNTGDKVKKGQLLVKIRSNDIIAQQHEIDEKISEVQSAFSNAKKDYNRMKALLDKESATRKEFDDSKTHYEMMKARLNAVKHSKTTIDEMLNYTHIKAPYSGVIVEKFVNEGDLAAPGNHLIAIEQPNNYEVIINVPESQISSIKKNDKVKVFIKSIHETVDGIISQVSPSSRFSGSQYEIHAHIVADDTKLKMIKTGMFTNVIFPGNQKNKCILIPKKLIVTKGQLYGIWTVSRSNTALLRWIRTGKDFGNNIEVLSGLRDGDRYIVSSESKLFNGTLLEFND